MMKSLYMLVPAALLLAGCASQGQVTNFEAEGNLEANQVSSCISPEAIDAETTAADLFAAAGYCARANRFEEASRFITLGLAFGRYDALRVEDRTAHQAIAAMNMELAASLSPEQTESLVAANKQGMKEGGGLRAFACDQVEAMDPPSYYPRYMIQHGMSAFLGREGDGLVKDFDSAAAWQLVQDAYLKCDQVVRQ